MISSVFNLILFQPLYNALVWLSGIVPGHSVALAIIILTILIRLILLPLYHQSMRTQRQLKEIEPKLQKIKEEQKDNREEQARQIMQLYRDHGINPLTGFMLLLIQLPVILALFYVFSRGFALDLDILYSFVQSPTVVDETLFGLFALTAKSYGLALLVGLSQYLQIRLTLPPLSPTAAKGTFQSDLARSMNMQMRYVMPVIITVIASQFPAAVALYWLTGNLFAIAHELVVRRLANRIYVGSK